MKHTWVRPLSFRRFRLANKAVRHILFSDDRLANYRPFVPIWHEPDTSNGNAAKATELRTSSDDVIV